MHDMVMFNEYKTLCAPHVQSLLPTLSRKYVMACLSGHSSLVALCSLVFSQVGH